MGRRDWPQEEANRLKALWPISTAHEISRVLRRNRNSVINKANRLGLEKGRDDNWSAQDIATLKRLRKRREITGAQMAALLGRSFHGCMTKAWRLGLGCRHRQYAKKCVTESARQMHSPSH
jgi:hypothetical protein